MSKFQNVPIFHYSIQHHPGWMDDRPAMMDEWPAGYDGWMATLHDGWMETTQKRGRSRGRGPLFGASAPFFWMVAIHPL